MSELFNILERLEGAVRRLEIMQAGHHSGKSVCSAGGPISVCTAGGSVSVCSSGGSISTCSAGGTVASRSAARSSCGSAVPAAVSVQAVPVPAASAPAGSAPAQSPAFPASGPPVSAYVQAYDDFINGPVAQYMSLSQLIGGDVLKQAEAMKQAFSGQRQVLVTASRFQKPSDDVLNALLRPMFEHVCNVEKFRDNRASTFYNHICAVSDSANALGWVVTVPPTMPGPHVKEMQEAAMFFTNRVLKNYKDNETHVRWVRAYLSTWTGLQSYIKEHHTTGLSWSKSGPVASASTAPTAGRCPPPHGPTSLPPATHSALSDGGSGGGSESRDALFIAINKGVGSLTKGLKHVSEDQKTKNNLGRGRGAPGRSGSKPPNAPPSSKAAVPPPVLELEGQRWKVENQVGAEGLVISDTELKQAVYAYKCSNSTLQVKGKITSITMDNCKKMGLVFDNVVSVVDVINCKDVKVQVLGKSPTININKTDGCQVYLSKDSLECEIISGKSSELNILVPDINGEFTEIPVPELFKTVLAGKKLVTTPAEII